MLLNAVSGAMC